MIEMFCRMNYSKLSTEQLTAVVRSLVRGDRVETLEITRQVGWVHRGEWYGVTRKTGVVWSD